MCTKGSYVLKDIQIDPMPENKDIKTETPLQKTMSSLYENESPSGSLVAIENSTPEIIHVVNVSSAHRSHQMAALESALNTMQTISLPASSLNFPLNLVSDHWWSIC